MEKKQAVGTVQMNQDRSIILNLRANDGKGTTGQAQFTLRPGQKGYDETLRRLKGIEPGQQKLLYEE